LWLSPAHAARGELLAPVAALAMAVTHWLNGVPFSPLTCLWLWPWQSLP
jgi:hypothetical protein